MDFGSTRSIFQRRLARAACYGAAVGLLATASLVGPGADIAYAAVSCEDGSRESAKAIAEAAPVLEPKGKVISGPRTLITLRYSEAFECAWALIESDTINLGPDDEVWLDRSSDGGLTWDSKLGERSRPNFDTNTYTAAFRAGGDSGYSVRACGRGSWEEQVDEGMLIPGPAGRLLNDAPEYETRYFDIACTGWYPTAAFGAAPQSGQTAESANWYPRDFFFDAEDRQIPLRNGWQAPFSNNGFGWLHIQARHPGQYSESRVEEVLESCRPELDGDNLRCEEDGYVVIYSDDPTEDEYIKGIITVFER